MPSEGDTDICAHCQRSVTYHVGLARWIESDGSMMCLANTLDHIHQTRAGYEAAAAERYPSPEKPLSGGEAEQFIGRILDMVARLEERVSAVEQALQAIPGPHLQLVPPDHDPDALAGPRTSRSTPHRFVSAGGPRSMIGRCLYCGASRSAAWHT